MTDDLILQIETVETELELVLEEQAEEIDLPVLMLGEVGPAGRDGAVAREVIGEIPGGAINGSNANFTTEFDFVPETVEVILNGIVQRRVADFNTTGTKTILLTESPLAGESIYTNYLRGD